MTRLHALIVAGAVLLAPSAARADDYFVKEGFRREGLMFGFGFGGGGFLSTSCCDIGGRRGAATGSFRIGTAMAPHRLWVLQADGGNVFVKQADESLEFNRQTALTLGIQHYLFETLWLKAGAGFATYTISADDDATAEVYRERNGYAATGSIGYDFLRKPDFFFRWRQDFALSFEFGMVAAIYPGGATIPNTMDEKEATGLIIQLHSMLGLVWY